MNTPDRELILKFLRDTQREGIESLITFLDESDFFYAPASTKYHGSYEGGLAEHSLNVMYELKSLCDFYGEEIPKDSIILTGLLHDVCKVNQYEKTIVNVPPNKTKSGKWEQQDGYILKSKLPMGHAPKSIFLIQNHIKLTDEEAQAIYWHMGAFDLGNYNNVNGLSDAFTMNRLAILLHMADMASTYIIENK